MIIAARRGGVGFESGAELAAVTGAFVVLWARRHRRPAGFELASTSTFAVLALGAHFVPSPSQARLDDLGRVITAGAMSVNLVASLAFRPVALQYTRDLVPRTVASTRTFLRAGVIDTVAWAVAALCVALSFLLATGLHDSIGHTLFNWLVPLVLTIACTGFLARRWSALEELGGLAKAPLAGAFDLLSPRKLPQDERGVSGRRPTLRLVGRDGRPRRRRTGPPWAGG